MKQKDSLKVLIEDVNEMAKKTKKMTKKKAQKQKAPVKKEIPEPAKKIPYSRLGLTLGILGSAYVFLMGILAYFHIGRPIVDILGSLYIGYEATILGSLIGAVWAFIDCYIAGTAGEWLYKRT